MKYEILSKEDVYKTYHSHPKLKYLFGFRGEFSGKESINTLIRIHNATKKEILHVFVKSSFKTRLIPDAKYKHSLSAILNVDESLFPKLSTLIESLPEKIRFSAVKKRNPGVSRLHIRGHKIDKTTWLLTAHMENNWMIPKSNW